MIRALALAVLFGLPAAAQDQITPDDFLDRATGRTLTFENFPDGGVVGVEQFLSRSRTVWTTPEGTCTHGRIEVRDALLCFIYDDLPDPEHCWLTFEHDGRLIVMAAPGSVQEVTRITRRPVTCQDVPISMGAPRARQAA